VQLKLNTDESPGVATEYGIRSIPTVMVFKVHAEAKKANLQDLQSAQHPTARLWPVRAVSMERLVSCDMHTII